MPSGARVGVIRRVCGGVSGIFAELARQYYDTANATSVPAMTALLKLVPVTQVTFGTDYPLCVPKT